MFLGTACVLLLAAPLGVAQTANGASAAPVTIPSAQAIRRTTRGLSMTSAAGVAQGAAMPDASGQPMVTTEGAHVPPDSAATSSPLSVLNRHAASTDSSVASGSVAQRGQQDSIAVGEKIQVAFDKTITSADVHNGQMVKGTLSLPLHTTHGRELPAGTPVMATVVAVAPAGMISSYGELTLQIVQVGSIGVLSDVLVTRGKEGYKELPDAAPAKGTEAMVQHATPMTFVIPMPAPPPTA
jgi:hypothetical protein